MISSILSAEMSWRYEHCILLSKISYHMVIVLSIWLLCQPSGGLADLHTFSAQNWRWWTEAASVPTGWPRACRSRWAASKSGLCSNTWLYMDPSHSVKRSMLPFTLSFISFLIRIRIWCGVWALYMQHDTICDS